MRRYIGPSLLAPLVVLFTMEGVRGLSEASLSFLGPAPDARYFVGTHARGRPPYIQTAWWVVAFPGLAIFISALSLNLIARRLRQVLDPLERIKLLSGRSNTALAGDDGAVNASDEAILRVRELRNDIPRRVEQARHAVDGVSFALRGGETLGIVGESGSGKSATALSLLRLLRSPWDAVSTGEIVLRGRDLMTLTEKEMCAVRGNDIAMVFQDPMTAFNPAMPIGRQIGEVLQLHRGMDRQAARARAIELLELVGIPDARSRVDRYPYEFSGGMRQRAMIAMALSCEPAVLIADEPTTGLDVTIQAQILELLDQLRLDLGMGIILITHDLGVVARMCDSVCVMYAGRIIEKAGVLDVFADPLHPYTLGLLGSMPGPEDTKGVDLTPIPGSPPDLGALPRGCAFEPRCPYSPGRQCQEEKPRLEAGTGTQAPHAKACFLSPGWRARR